ncbi:MAG TPA: hypothetical protein VNA19_02495 [Pyrinomonadaceae bacterium]|nr:hypothetical protein [Pyrinomonadaceae bacterium]
MKIPTRMARPKGDMFQNLRRPEEVESLSVEEIVAHPVSVPSIKEKSQEEPNEPNPPQPTPSPTIPHHPPPSSPAPLRDFNRRANSLERDALPAGLFPGSSKKLYDALYLRTRGAVQPRTQIRATKRDLMDWSGIRNVKTIETHIRYLMGVGLINRTGDNGDREGYAYDVKLPEQAGLPTPTNTIPPQPQPTDTIPNQHQKTGMGGAQKSVLVGVGQTIETKEDRIGPKTFFKTSTESDDDDAALAGLVATLKRAATEITGKTISATESDRWRELGEVLVAELRIAAARTSVSSVPAFLAEHLRRRLWKIDKKQARVEGRELPDESGAIAAGENASDCPDCLGSGWWYPNGQEKGVAKCKHAPLAAVEVTDKS